MPGPNLPQVSPRALKLSLHGFLQTMLRGWLPFISLSPMASLQAPNSFGPVEQLPWDSYHLLLCFSFVFTQDSQGFPGQQASMGSTWPTTCLGEQKFYQHAAVLICF